MAIDISTETTLITGEEFAQMKNLGSCELVDERIVEMSPTSDEHRGYEGNVYDALRAFVRPRQLGKVRVGEVGVYTQRNPDIVRGVDVLYISKERYARKSNKAFLDVAPDLIVEILSPSNGAIEMTRKLREYFAIGVRLVWLVDPDEHSVLVYRSLTDLREFTSDDELPGDDVLPGFSVKVATLFED